LDNITKTGKSVNEGYNFNLISENRKYLLGIACIFILFFHSRFAVGQDTTFYLIKKNFQFGVDIFLFLSGIGLYYSYSKNHNMKEFYKKRFLRIIPIYLPVVLVWFAWYDKIMGRGISDYFSDVTLISFFTENNVLEWFIAVILVFYLAYPFIHNLFIIKMSYKIFPIYLIILPVILSISIYWLLYNDVYFISENNRGWFEMIFTRVPVFLFGCSAGYFVKNNYKTNYVRTITYSVFVIVLCIMLLYFEHGIFAQLKFRRCLYAPFSVALCIVLSDLLNLLNNGCFIKRFLEYISNYTLETYLIYEKVEFICINKDILPYIDEKEIVRVFISLFITLIISEIYKYFCDLFFKRKKKSFAQ